MLVPVCFCMYNNEQVHILTFKIHIRIGSLKYKSHYVFEAWFKPQNVSSQSTFSIGLMT